MLYCSATIATSINEVRNRTYSSPFVQFYFGMLSVITPPVAMASFTAAGLAGEKPSKVGWLGARIAIPAFIIPFIFVSSPELLFIGATPLRIITAICTSLVGVVALASAAHGYLISKLSWYSYSISYQCCI